MAKNIRRTPSPPPVPPAPEDFPAATVDPFPLPEAAQEAVTESPIVEKRPASAKKRGDKTVDRPQQVQIAFRFQPSARTRFLGGWFALLTGLFLCAACISYLFCWWIDYDVLSGFRFAELWRPDAPELKVVGNKLGGFFAYSFIHKGFGLAGLLFPIVLTLFGLQCLGLRQYRWQRLRFHGVSILLLSSLLLGSLPFLQGNRFAVLGGEVGFQVSTYLKNLLGNLGFYLLWSFLLICFLAMSRLIAAVPYTIRKRQPSSSATADDLPETPNGKSTEADDPEADGSSGENTVPALAAGLSPDTVSATHTPIQSYIPAELRTSDDIRMEVHRRPDEAPSLLDSRPTHPAPIPPPTPSPVAAVAAVPATTIGSALASAGTTAPASMTGGIALSEIPLASHTISDTLTESLARDTTETEAARNEMPAPVATQTAVPTLRIDDIPLTDGSPLTTDAGSEPNDLAAGESYAPAADAPVPPPPLPADEVGFTVERPTEAEPPVTTTGQPAHIGLDTPYDPRLELRDYRFPTLELLEDFGTQETQVQEEELLSNKNRIVETLLNYGIKIDTIKATIGPTVTLYEIVPAAGIRISKIKNLEDDIALSLAALGIRIIAPIPGKGTIGIEVPNQNKQIVPMRDMICCQKFQNEDYALPIALGKTISNEAYVTDLAKMPHLLVAGATGQGKSVGLNAIIASLLYKKHPAELKFVMVDPKKVELSLFNKIERHYLAKLPDAEEAIITDTRKVVRTLNSLCIEMDTRYDLLKNAGAKNIKEYNKKFIARRLNPENGHRFLPYIVLIIDEFADLIMTAGKEIEMPIARLAQLARAIGIHLVIATQRPSVNIITGTIKANFPARIAFKVSSKTDSRTILDGSGADQLIGRGDMLLSTGNELVRIQCAYIDTPEIERITEYIGEQRAYPYAYELPDCPEDGQEGGGRGDLAEGDRDSLFEEVARFVVSAQQGSTSSIQRKFKLGYNRAGRIIDQLEDAGIVGPLERNTREVRVKDPVALEQLLNADRSII